MSDPPRERRSWLRAGLRRAAAAAASRLRPAALDGPPSLGFPGRPAAPVARGSTILEGALAAGLDLSHYCGGKASCGTCRVEIVSGAANLSPPEGRERMVLGHERAAAGDRLACQARVLGPVEARIPRWF